MAKMEVKLAYGTASGEPDISNNNYAGEGATGYILASVLSGDTLANQTVKIHQNLTSALDLRLLDSASIVQAGGCEFVHSGTVDVDHRTLTPTDLKVNLDLCKNELAGTWEHANAGMRGSRHFRVPTEFINDIMLEVGGKVGENIENHVWNGEVGGATGYALLDGFYHIVDTGSGTADAGTYTVGTSDAAANAVATLRALYAAVPVAVRRDPSFRIYAPPALVEGYIQALGNSGYGDLYSVGTKPLNIDGHEIIEAKGAVSPMCGRMDNFNFGCDAISDFAAVRILDMEETEGSDNIRVVMKFRAGCQVARLNEAGYFATLA